MAHRSVRHAQSAQPVNPELAVHDGIRVGTDLCGAHGVAEAGRCGPREINDVLTADRVRAGNDLCLAHVVERRLTAQFPGRFDCLYNRVHIVIGTQ